MRLLKVVGFVAALAASGPALAQSGDPTRPPDLSRYLRWGPLHVRPGLVIPQVGRDDNVKYCYDGEADCTRLSDFVVTVSPRLDGLFFLGKRAFVTFNERFDYSFYSHDDDAEYGDLNYGNNYLSGRIALPLRRIALWSDLAHNRIRERPIEQENVRPTQRENRVGFGARVTFGWRTDLDLGFTRSDWQYTIPGVSLAVPRDRVEDQIRVKGRYLLAGRTRATVDFSDKTVDYDDPAYPGDGNDRRVLGGLDFGLGGRLSGNLRVGAADVDMTNPALEDYRGMVGDAALAWRFGRAGSVATLEAKRDVVFTIYEVSGIFVDRLARLRLVNYFNRIFGVEASAGRGKLDFPGLTRRDDYWVASGGLRVRLSETEIGRRIEYTLNVTRYERTSTDPGLDQSRTTVGFGAIVGY